MRLLVGGIDGWENKQWKKKNSKGGCAFEILEEWKKAS